MTANIKGWPGKGGSGPLAGMIGITNCSAVAALKNYFPKSGEVEFVYAPDHNRFAAGVVKMHANLDGSKHQQLATALALNADAVIVGGTMSRRMNPLLLGKEMNVICMPPTIEQPYCWLFAYNEQKIGVHQREGWCTQLRNEAPLFFDIEDKCVLLLILLDLEPGEFDRYLAQARHLVPDFADSIDRFPLTELLQHTLHTSVSDYWPDKALAWLDAKPAMQPGLAAELERLVSNKAMSQSLRHRARRMLRHLQAHHSYTSRAGSDNCHRTPCSTLDW